jgi:hypothetical protein
MTIEIFFAFALVALVILIKLVLLALALILIGQGLFGRRSSADAPARDDRPSLSGS